MNANDQELCFAVGRDVMDWKAEPAKYETTDATGIWIYEDKVIKGLAYKNNFAPTETPYNFIWHAWNPIEVANDYMEIVDRLFAQGHYVILTGKASGKFTCDIVNGQHNEVSAMCTDTSRGRAICTAALMFFESCKQVDDSLSPADRLKALLRMKLRNAELPAIYRRATIDSSGDCYAWPVRPVAGKTVWVGATDEEKCLGVLEIPDGVRWQNLIVDIEDTPAAIITRQDSLVTARY